MGHKFNHLNGFEARFKFISSRVRDVQNSNFISVPDSDTVVNKL